MTHVLIGEERSRRRRETDREQEAMWPQGPRLAGSGRAKGWQQSPEPRRTQELSP